MIFKGSLDCNERVDGSLRVCKEVDMVKMKDQRYTRQKMWISIPFSLCVRAFRLNIRGNGVSDEYESLKSPCLAEVLQFAMSPINLNVLWA